MLRTRLILPLAFASVAFMYGCQEQASSPTGPEGSGPLFTHKGADKPHGGPKSGGDDGDDGGDTKVTWSEAFARVDGQTSFVLDNTNTLQSNIHFPDIGDAPDPRNSDEKCFGFPGAKTSNPTVEWNDEPGGENEGSTDGCAQVTTTGTDDVGPVTLTNDALLIVGTKKGSTKFTIQFQIQDVGGPDGIQYRTDKFVVNNGLNKPFTGEAPFTLLHVHKTVTIYRLKGHTGGPKDANVGTIQIDDIVYSD